MPRCRPGFEEALPYVALPYAALPYAALPYAALPYAALPYAALAWGGPDAQRTRKTGPRGVNGSPAPSGIR
ncbi:hypothetical protein ACH4KT_28065 [Streptomyces anulatus]